MTAARTAYFREYKRRQRAARLNADRCADCGAPFGPADFRLVKESSPRTIARRAVFKVMGKGRTPEAPFRCARCREKELARLRRTHPLPDLSDPKTVKRLLRDARLELEAWLNLPDGPKGENVQAKRAGKGYWYARIQRLEEEMFWLKAASRRASTRRKA